jgi:hypothetical protein
MTKTMNPSEDLTLSKFCEEGVSAGNLIDIANFDIARYKSLIEQSCSCTIIYFDRPYSFCDLVTWPTTISDDTLLYTQISLLYHVKVLSQYMLDKCTKDAFNYSRCLYDKCIVACSHRTSQDTSPLLNKVVRAPSDILIGQTRSATSSHGLPQYLMIHLPFCSIYVT